MSKPIIAIKTSPRNYSGLVNLGNSVAAGLTANPAFTTPLPSVLSLQADVDAVVLAIGVWGPKGNRGSHEALVDLRAKAVVLSQTLKSLAQYVMNTAQSSFASDYVAMGVVIQSSGFQLRNTNTPQGVLQMPQNFHQFISRKLRANQVKLKWKKPLNTTSVGNVKSYKIYRGTTNVFSSAIIIDTVTKTSFIDTNNTIGTITWSYWVVANNNQGDSVETAALTLAVVGI